MPEPSVPPRTTAEAEGPVTLLDLRFQVEGTIGAFLVRTSAGPVLVETGPESLYGHLEAAVRAAGHALEEIRHVFVTHVHLDHAGAAWRLARHGARIHVHPKGAPHLQDPSKLLHSATRIYGEAMDRLWGRLEPIAAENLVAVEDGATVEVGDATFQALHTPGHAVHHITWRLDDGLFTGDVGGIRMGDGPAIPPFPPPDIDLEAWLHSIARMREAHPATIFPTHFGIKRDGAAHLDSLEENLHRIAGWVRDHAATGASEAELIPPFQAFMRALLAGHGLTEAEVEDYEIADPAFMSVHGLVRYWRKRGLAASLT